MPELTVDFTCECDVCGSSLECNVGMSTVYVCPCQTCLDAASDAARADSYDAGRAEGYESGLSDGFREADESGEGGE